jgi:hypothetical protein
MATAWVFTIPAAGAMGALVWEVAQIFGKHSTFGAYVMAVLTAGAAAGLFALAQRNRITAGDLDRTATETRRPETAITAAAA